MPMFYTPKPRQFRYQPRFYDPEKERWEALKTKYATERMLREMDEASAATEAATEPSSNADLEYFRRRVREIESDKREKKRGLTWQDFFRKREMPTFNYQPRFTAEGSTGEHTAEFKERTTKIKRRFDISDEDYRKPVSAGRLLLYSLLVCALLYWVAS